jgi:HEAT repeat protein
MKRSASEKKLEAIEALHQMSPGPARDAAIRKAIADPAGYVVAKAATLATLDMVEDLENSFSRLLEDGPKRDPQCLGKTAIVKSLKNIGHRDPTLYLRGLRCVQREPTWGGEVDTAAVLRGSCALALTDCTLGDFEILSHLTPGLADNEKSVRVDTALAIGQLGREEGAMLLKLRVIVGDPEGEVLGQCFASLLALTPAEGVAFAASFLTNPDADLRLEAACALAGSREPAAIAALRPFWEQILPADTRRAVIFSLGASPLRQAAEFLLQIAKSGPRERTDWALDSLRSSRFQEEFAADIAEIKAIGSKDRGRSHLH